MTAAEKLAALRAITKPPDDWDDPEWIGTECRRCNTTTVVPFGYEPAPTCNSCAQDVLEQVRALLALPEAA